jgi:BirA family biotin operon repressor/biotin-[acetyl-CoA-carboxylase] ligase
VTPAERILAWLRAARGPLSGEELARRLECSRAAVWKHVAALRRDGYAIDARRARGYRLVSTPDRLGPAELAPHLRGRWREVVWRAEIDSTQRLARERARAGAPEGTVVVAETQTQGRGRLGRTWHSPPGVNLYCTIVLRPERPPAVAPQLALVAGLAVADAVREASGLDARVKWPNDVLVGGRKVAGVLTEMEGSLERVAFVLVGIGVNVNGAQASFPPAIRRTATSLRAASGRAVDRAAFTGALLAALEARYGRFLAGGFAAIRRDWEAVAFLTGRDVRVRGIGIAVEGRVVGVDQDGALRLARPGGGVARIVAGEVTLRGGERRRSPC